MLFLDVGRLDEADAAIVEGRAQREASGHTDTADLDFVGASIEVVRGRTSEGIERMMDVARGARDARLESTGVTSYRVAAAFAMRVMDYERAEVGLREGLRYADEIQQSYCRHVMAATSAHVAWAGGAWDEAIPIAEIEIVERGSRRERWAPVTRSATFASGAAISNARGPCLRRRSRSAGPLTRWIS